MADTNLIISIITLNVNGLNTPTEKNRDCVSEWIKKNKLLYFVHKKLILNIGWID